MKTTRLYEHLSLERFRPSAKRGWKRRLGGWLWTLIWMVLVSLALWGLFAWATGRVMPVSGLKPELRTAGFAVPQWAAWGIVAVIAALVVWRLITGARDEREPTMEDGEGWGDKPVPFEGADPLADGDTLKREQRAIEGMPSGLTRRDAAEIARAAAAEIELCRRMVDGAMHALSVEDYSDALAGASRRLGQVRVTLRELGMTFDQGGIDRA